MRCDMTWTFDPAAIQYSDLMKVRIMTGDTDESDKQLEDEVIDYVLTVYTSPTLAAASACDLIAAKYLRQCNTENSALRVSAAARHKHYLEMAATLRAGGAGDMPGDPKIIQATMSVGGTSVDAKEALRADSDNIGNQFAIGMDDHPDLGSPTTDPWDPLD